MVVEGNHEIEQQVGNKSFVAYSARFAFPSQESGSSSTFYYSFNAGGIHFVMLGGYIDYNKTGLTISSGLEYILFDEHSRKFYRCFQMVTA